MKGVKTLEDLTNPRTLRIVEKLKAAASEFIQEAKGKDVIPFFSAHMIAEKSGVSLTSTYKYFDQLVAAIGMQRQCYLVFRENA
jgi:hypothetical protein